MCLIVFAWRSNSQHKLLVAANRDEYYARPTAPLHAWQEAPHILAGRDLEHGGTWLGATRTGRFAALTNVRNPTAALGTQSRGFLVRDFLQHTESPERFYQQLQPNLHAYSPFNLLIGDGDNLFYLNHTGSFLKLPPGVYGLSNAQLDTPWPKLVQGKQQLQNLLTRDVGIDALLALLAHDETAADEDLPNTGIDTALEKKLSSRFIHFEGYGTRCSTLLLQSRGNSILHERRFNTQGKPDGDTHYSWPIENTLNTY